jgi:hypothetical protein
MGYYSDVMLVTDYTNKMLVEEIFAKWAEHENASGGNVLSWAENPEGFEYVHYEGPFYKRREVKLIMWEWKQVRWGYPWSMTDEITAELEKVLYYQEAPVRIPYAHFGLIVLGEDTNDNKEFGSPSDYGMGIQKEITW